jgi:L-alanine-DL-glutamate epimerase-like enolase superfamily enzyme
MGPPIERVRASAYRIPTETSTESDGTLAWSSTTLILAEVAAGGLTGLGYTYAEAPAASLIGETFAPLLLGRDAYTTREHWLRLLQAIRNAGPGGLATMAHSAVDTALWDLKAKLLDVPLSDLLGRARDRVPGYGSGGFTSFSLGELESHCHHWRELGVPVVKIKVGREPKRDVERVQCARRALGDEGRLLVDANGGYDRKQALELGRIFHDELGVTWLEEPVPSDDLEGLRLIRDSGPAGLDIAAGEYGYGAAYFHAMLAAGAVDVLQADATRCGGITGFMDAAAVAYAAHIPLSSHCAPALHLPVCAAVPGLRHMELFFDHVRIESMLFDGAPRLDGGLLAPDPTRPGLGLTFRYDDAKRFRLPL